MGRPYDGHLLNTQQVILRYYGARDEKEMPGESKTTRPGVYDPNIFLHFIRVIFQEKVFPQRIISVSTSMVARTLFPTFIVPPASNYLVYPTDCPTL